MSSEDTIYIYTIYIFWFREFVGSLCLYISRHIYIYIYIYIYIFRLKKEKRMHSSVIMFCPHNHVDCIRRGPRKVVKASDRLIILC